MQTPNIDSLAQAQELVKNAKSQGRHLSITEQAQALELAKKAISEWRELANDAVKANPEDTAFAMEVAIRNEMLNEAFTIAENAHKAAALDAQEPGPDPATSITDTDKEETQAANAQSDGYRVGFIAGLPAKVVIAKALSNGLGYDVYTHVNDPVEPVGEILGKLGSYYNINPDFVNAIFDVCRSQYPTDPARAMVSLAVVLGAMTLAIGDAKGTIGQEPGGNLGVAGLAAMMVDLADTWKVDYSNAPLPKFINR